MRPCRISSVSSGWQTIFSIGGSPEQRVPWPGEYALYPPAPTLPMGAVLGHSRGGGLYLGRGSGADVVRHAGLITVQSSFPSGTRRRLCSLVDDVIPIFQGERVGEKSGAARLWVAGECFPRAAPGEGERPVPPGRDWIRSAARDL